MSAIDTNDSSNQTPSSPLHPASNDPAPSYEEITISPDGPPPSYDSLFGKVKDARDKSSGVYDFFKKVFLILLTTLGCAITLGFSLLLPGSFLIVGSVYVHDCPVENMIPIFLIVLGVKGVISVLLSLYLRHILKKEDPEIPDTPDEAKAKKIIDGIEKILQSFIMAWIIAGSIWVYRVTVDYSPESDIYCHKIVYRFAFWIITLTYLSILFVIVIGCCLCSCFILREIHKDDQPETNAA